LTAVAAALVSLVLITLPVLAAWGASAQESVPWSSAVGVGRAAWLLAHFVPLDVGGHRLSLTPLLLAAVPAVVTFTGAARVAGRSVARAVAFVAPYAACLVLAVVLSWSGPWAESGSVVADLGRAVLAGVLLPGAAYVLAAWRHLEPGSVRLRGRLAGVGVLLRRAVAPALWGTAALVLAGALLVVTMAVLQRSSVGAVYAELAPGVVGTLLLTGGQLLVLPNLALWAVSFLAGPGFALGGGQMVTWAASEPSALPLVPVFAALPAPGPLPSWMWAGAAVPVLAGVLVGWRSLRRLSRYSTARVKLQTAATACLLCAMTVAVLTALAGGGLGSAPMQGLGAPPLLLFATVLAELGCGSVLAVGWSHVRAKRR
ncbi:MAG TPA: DUF6350 family protein, partial [Dermatophilaceae bacterium]|nr:DUF6350 family protein [Dermatophilaceae bacterium]